ncbi:hypothetical protein RI129_007592, partial [Pyrocoelia pectoralis]
RIVKEATMLTPGTKLTSPRKSIAKPSKCSVVDVCGERIVRNIIYTYASVHKTRPTMKVVFEI